MKKIIICTTFREFDGNANDKIQRLFIESLKKQSYQNYILVVTTFKEKNVNIVLNEEIIPHIIFQGDVKEHRYSLTQVFINGIKIARENEDSILVWTTCDVIFDKNFFKILTELIKKETCGTSYPHISYSSLNNYNKKKGSHLLWYGIDTIFFNSDIFREIESEQIIKKYINNGWGHFEYFLTAFGLIFSKKMINIKNYSKIRKIDNDRKVSNETAIYLSNSDKANAIIFRQFIKDFKINKKSIKSLDSIILFLNFRSNLINNIWLKIMIYNLVILYKIKYDNKIIKLFYKIYHKIKKGVKLLFNLKTK